MFNIPINDIDIISKNIQNMLKTNDDIKPITPRLPLHFTKNETDNYIFYRINNKNTASIYLTIKKNSIDNLNELESFTADANQRKSVGVLKAILQNKVKYNVR